MEHFIDRPVGLDEFTDEIDSNCFKADVYTMLGFRHSHYIVNLDSGSGRTTRIRYMTGMYKAWGVCGFENSRRQYLEFVTDGSECQLDDIFAQIDRRAEHGGRFDGIVAIDITRLAHSAAEKTGKELTERFIKYVKDTADHAYFVFFTSSQLDKREIELCSSLKNRIFYVKQLYLPPYSTQQLAQILEKSLVERGIYIDDYKRFHRCLMDFLREFAVNTVPGALDCAGRLVQFADCGRLLPVLNAGSIKQMADTWQKKEN